MHSDTSLDTSGIVWFCCCTAALINVYAGLKLVSRLDEVLIRHRNDATEEIQFLQHKVQFRAYYMPTAVTLQQLAEIQIAHGALATENDILRSQVALKLLVVLVHN